MEETELFFYSQEQPIDFFHGAISFSQYLLQIQDECFMEEDIVEGIKEREACVNRAIKQLVEAISRLARAFRTWEGDVRDEVYVFGLPTKYCTLEIGYIIKQDSNGGTFVISPQPLDWLQRSEAER